MFLPPCICCLRIENFFLNYPKRAFGICPSLIECCFSHCSCLTVRLSWYPPSAPPSAAAASVKSDETPDSLRCTSPFDRYSILFARDYLFSLCTFSNGFLLLLSGGLSGFRMSFFRSLSFLDSWENFTGLGDRAISFPRVDSTSDGAA